MSAEIALSPPPKTPEEIAREYPHLTPIQVAGRVKVRETYEKLAEAIRAKGAECELRESESPYGRRDPFFVINGEISRLNIQVSWEGYGGGSDVRKWAMQLPRLRISLGVPRGRYGRTTKGYPEPKSGFDFAKIAAAILQGMDVARAEREQEEKQRERAKDAEKLADLIHTEAGKPKNVRLKAYPDWAGDPPEHVFVLDLNEALSANRMRTLLHLLNANGFLTFHFSNDAPAPDAPEAP